MPAERLSPQVGGFQRRSSTIPRHRQRCKTCSITIRIRARRINETVAPQWRALSARPGDSIELVLMFSIHAPAVLIEDVCIAAKQKPHDQDQEARDDRHQFEQFNADSIETEHIAGTRCAK
jgi:hypothetical protein